MHHIYKSAIVPYSCEKMYQLVNEVENYPQFLNWCKDASILKQNDEQITALVNISKGVFDQSFTTINTLSKNKRIDMKLKDGPFHHLSGAWIFTRLNENACKVELKLQFDFSSKIMDMSISPIFVSITNSQLDAFVARAKEIYN